MNLKGKLAVVLVLLGMPLAVALLLLYLAQQNVLSGPQAGLMFISLVGMYVGFGTLILVYRLISKLE